MELQRYQGMQRLFQTVESYPKSRSPIKKEGVQHYSDRWSKRSKVYILTVKGVSDTKYSKAAKYAMSQSGKSYNWVFANKFRVDKYYCSQLVWRAWNKQGKEIDYVTKDTIVTPIELVKSKNTTIIYHKK